MASGDTLARRCRVPISRRDTVEVIDKAGRSLRARGRSKSEKSDPCPASVWVNRAWPQPLRHCTSVEKQRPVFCSIP